LKNEQACENSVKKREFGKLTASRIPFKLLT